MNTQEGIIIVIPALNPGEKLLNLVNEIKAAGFPRTVIVNDGSSMEYENNFSKLASLEGITVLTHCINLGKGRALKTAVNYVVNEYPDCKGIITADADGQHKIEDIQKCGLALLECWQENEIILGCRCFSDTEKTKIPFRSKAGNVCTKIVMQYLCNIKVSDTQTGLRAIPAHLLPKLMKISGEGYEYETNMLLELTEGGGHITEIPIETVYEGRNEVSHFNPLKDSAKIYKTILTYSFSSGMAAIIDNAVFILFMPYITNLWLLTFLGRFISVLVNFTLNKKIVFKTKQNTGVVFCKYILLVIFSGTISAFALVHISQLLGKTSILVKICIETVLYFFNYYIQKKFIFGGSLRGKQKG